MRLLVTALVLQITALSAATTHAQTTGQKLAQLERSAAALSHELSASPLPSGVALLPSLISAQARRWAADNSKALHVVNFSHPATGSGNLSMIVDNAATGTRINMDGKRVMEGGADVLDELKFQLRKKNRRGGMVQYGVEAYRYANGKIYDVTLTRKQWAPGRRLIRRNLDVDGALFIASSRGGKPVVVHGSCFAKRDTLSVAAEGRPSVDASTKVGMNQLLRPHGMHIRTVRGKHHIVYNPGHKPR